eukprot:CAMPEP_0113916150 /NCGR_PEP_ID=MMETSP0780_2-20120614/31822_1 /TAXON_ID=652834 /ORGANISM="Palpitomonas bilix" /LENGTH=545 /DNA_ID=CAMNT_0000915187 /DNA_START=385 /DNA_END=2023 /DNA_ORIENTATION=- /assembly_acc=CAM_ASM_000599
MSLRVWQRPRLLQDWHEEQEDRKVAWTELFYDLVFVSVIGRLGDEYKTVQDGSSLTSPMEMGTYVVLFLGIYYVWVQSLLFATRFHVEDLFSNVYHALLMACVVVIGVNMDDPLGSKGMSIGIAFAAAKLLFCLAYLRVWIYVKRIRVFVTVTVALLLVEGGLWLGSAFITSPTAKLCVQAGSSLVSFCHPFVFSCLPRKARVPLHITHFSERIGCVIIITMGESAFGVTQSIVGATNALGDMAFYFSSVLFLLTLLIFKIFYFDADPAGEENHALRTSLARGITWSNIHPLLAMAVSLFGTGVSLIVHYSPSTNMTNTSYWQSAEGMAVESAQGIVFGCAAAIYICLATIQLMHNHTEISEDYCLLPKRGEVLRLGRRKYGGAAIRIIAACTCIPFAVSPFTHVLPYLSAIILGGIAIIALAADYLLVFIVERKARHYLPPKFFKRGRANSDRREVNTSTEAERVLEGQQDEDELGGLLNSGGMEVDEELLQAEQARLRRARVLSRAKEVQAKEHPFFDSDVATPFPILTHRSYINSSLQTEAG